MAANKGNGKGIRWLQDHVSYPHKDWCLVWPFSTLHGYGQFGYLGKNYYAHRYMCQLVNGEPPTEAHQAAHSCGNGHKGCVNPHHLSWKTQSENQLDCRKHGTQDRSHYGIYGCLDHEKAEQIRALKGVKLQREVAEMYGVSESAISDVWLGRTWTKQHKNRGWKPDEDERLRAELDLGKSYRQVATAMGRPYQGIVQRARRLGLFCKSGHHACRFL